MSAAAEDRTFRCSLASLRREEPPAGTASTVRAFLLIEEPGPWGQRALLDSRLPGDLGPRIAEAAQAADVRPLLIRRHRRSQASDQERRVVVVHVDDERSWAETTTVRDVGEVLDLDLTALRAGRSPGLEPHADALFLVCTHGRHDACCAEFGRPVAEALTASYPDATWEVSHLGGDRFAPNVLVLPQGLYYGRLDAESAPEMADQHLRGHLSLPHLRGRSDLPMTLQAAEIGLRQHLELTARGGVRCQGSQRDGEVMTATFEVGSRTYAVRVRSTHAPEADRLTCSAVRSGHPWRHEVVEISALDA